MAVTSEELNFFSFSLVIYKQSPHGQPLLGIMQCILYLMRW